MGTIASALDRIVTLQNGLAITTPVAASISTAYKYPPDPATAFPNTPCFVNTWTFDREERGASQRRLFYTVRMQLFVANADPARAADIATAFHVQLGNSLDADVTLNGAVTEASRRGEDPTLVRAEWADRSYVGTDEFVDLVIVEAHTFAP